MDVPLDSASSVLSIISSIGSMLQSYLAIRQSGRESAPSQEELKVAHRERDALLQSASHQIATAISSKMVDQLREDAEKLQQQIRDAFRSSVPIATKDMIIAGLVREYCWYLMHIKTRMKDKFPPELEEERRENNCDQYKF